MIPKHGKTASELVPQDVSRVKGRILLVDDDAAVLLTLKAVLELNQYEVDAASSTAEAKRKLASSFYHLVITDARMDSETAGFEVFRIARRQPYKPATALLTTYARSDRDWHEAKTLLVRPIGMQDLLRQIEVLLGRHGEEKRMPHPLHPPRTRYRAENWEGKRKIS